MDKKTIKERYTATLVGSALGDTMGMPVEGWKREQIKRYISLQGGGDNGITRPIGPVLVYADSDRTRLVENDEFGPLKYYTKNFKKGEYTDDTMLALAIAEAIVESFSMPVDASGVPNLPDLLTAVSKRFVLAYDEASQKFGEDNSFGKTTREAMKRLKSGMSPYDSGVIGGPGNGTAMCAHPIGIYMHSTGKVEEGLGLAYNIARMTHLDPRSIAGGMVQAYAIYFLLSGAGKEDFIGSLFRICDTYEQPLDATYRLAEAGNLVDRLHWIRENQIADEETAYKKLGCSSEIFRSYPFALFMFQKYWDKPVEGLLKTINYGGDCDTTGAIFGALAGARHGMVFPEEWVSEIVGIERIIEAAKGLLRP